MSESVEAAGRTVEDAIDAALAMLGAREDEVEIQILSEGLDHPNDVNVRGEARVRASFRDERTEDDHRAAREEAREQAGASRERLNRIDSELAERLAGVVETFLEGLMEVLDLDASIDVRATPFGVAAELHGDDLALLIGRHGLTLAALQEMCRAVAQRESDERSVVTVDIENYLVRRREVLERMAFKAADKVRKTGQDVALEPMTARDRKIVHDALSDTRSVTTGSDGQEPNRFVVISPA